MKEKERSLTDEQVEREIARLLASPAVALAKKEERIRNRRRQYMYSLRVYEKKGLALMSAGITEEMLERAYTCDEDDI